MTSILLTGIAEIGIPPLDPAKVSKLELNREGALTMSLVFSNSTHFGLGDLKVKSARWWRVYHYFSQISHDAKSFAFIYVPLMTQILNLSSNVVHN